MTIKYISIKSVLHHISSLLDDRYWNEVLMLEWALRGVRQINSSQLLEGHATVLEVCNHKFTLPNNFYKLEQILYTTDTTTANITAEKLGLPTTSHFVDNFIGNLATFKWLPMRMTSGSVNSLICLNPSLKHCTDCKHEFSIDSSLVGTTTLKEGLVIVTYLGYPIDENGEYLIPDYEPLKEALTHYVLYLYWLSKFTMKEEGSESRIKFHLDMWNTLSKKALNLNLPDVNQMENMKNQFNKLVPRTNEFDGAFLKLGNSENVNF